MLADIIEFVQSRTDLASREAVLREINAAWREIWGSDDLPNSVFEVSVSPFDNTARVSLPYFVGVIRGVKSNIDRLRVNLLTPRPYYQDEQYFQSPYTWRILGLSPLSASITNATKLHFSIEKTESTQFTITIIGTDDNGSDVRDQIVVPPGTTDVWSNLRFTDASSIVKDTLTASNVEVAGANGEDFGIIPNLAFEARNTVIQITDKCLQCCNNCRCFDVLFKKPAPVLFYDEQNVPFPEVLINKTLELISMPKDGQEAKAQMYAQKAQGLLSNYNNNESSVEKRLDLGKSLYETYTGSGWPGGSTYGPGKI